MNALISPRPGPSHLSVHKILEATTREMVANVGIGLALVRATGQLGLGLGKYEEEKGKSESEDPGEPDH